MISHLVPLGIERALLVLSSAGLALIIVAAFAYSAGHRAGIAKVETEVRAAQERLAGEMVVLRNDLRKKTAALDAAQAERQTLVERLEDDARRDVDAPSRKPSFDSLRRLQKRWGTP